MVERSPLPGGVRTAVHCRQDVIVSDAAGKRISVSISSVDVASTNSTDAR
jgi:hypothetical protein